MPKFEKYFTRKYSFFADSLIFAIFADHSQCTALTGIPDYVSNIEHIRDCKLFTVTFSRHVLQLVHGHFSNCPEV